MNFLCIVSANHYEFDAEKIYSNNFHLYAKANAIT